MKILQTEEEEEEEKEDAQRRARKGNMNERIRVIDLDTGRIEPIAWGPEIPESAFELFIETQIRSIFEVTDEAFVDLVDLGTQTIIPMQKQAFAKVQQNPLCLCLSPKTNALAPLKKYEIHEVQFRHQTLGMSIRKEDGQVVVNRFKRGENGSPGEAELTGTIALGDIIYRVQGERTLGKSYEAIIQMLQIPIRPLRIEFFRPLDRTGLYAVEFKGEALNLTISSRDEDVIVKSLPQSHPNIMGYAEARGVRPGDIIHAINGEIIHSYEYSRAVSLLRSPERPLVVVFARSSRPITYGSTPGASPARTSRFSFASSVAPSPSRSTDIQSMKSFQHPSRSADIQSMKSFQHPSLASRTSFHLSSAVSSVPTSEDNMSIDDMLEYLNFLCADELITEEENAILREMVLNARSDLCSAIRHKRNNAIVAIVKSPRMKVWNHLLKAKENIVLAAPVTMKRNKRVHLVLTDLERLLIISKEKNKLKEEIACSDIVTVSSRSKYSELCLDTKKGSYVLIDHFIGPSIWVRAILPFTCTQGYLKVASSKRLFGPKKRYFVLQEQQLLGYKKESAASDQSSKKKSMKLVDATVEINDSKNFTFSIITPEMKRENKRLTLIAPNAREFNKWLGALRAMSTQRSSTVAASA